LYRAQWEKRREWRERGGSENKYKERIGGEAGGGSGRGNVYGRDEIEEEG